MIEHPDITAEFAADHYDSLLQDAERIRQIRAFEATQKQTSLLNTLSHWTNDLKFWGRPVRGATTRA